MLQILESAALDAKKILLRIDSDVDIKDGAILDDTRLVSSLDTLNFLISKNAQITIVGHLGRPEKKFTLESFPFDSHDQLELNLKPIASWFATRLQGQVEKVRHSDFPAWKIKEGIVLLENIRFFEGEEEANSEFAQKLASLADIFVNEAFAVSHREHASTAGIASILPSFAGLHFQKEVEVLSKVLQSPERPLVVIIGGAKIETKLPMVEKMHHVADYVLVGGEIADQTKVLAQVQHEHLTDKKSVLLVADNNESGFDISQNSIENFIQVINTAATIVWNGPVGMTGKDKIHEEGTKRIADAIAATSAYKVVGGGDTVSYLSQNNMLEKFDFVSTGGGAMLEFLSGKQLPAIKPLIR